MSKQIKDLEDYGDLIAFTINGFRWSYKTYGSYQGDYIAIIEKAGKILIYKGYYGSCSGCDWFEDNMQGYSDEPIKVTAADIKEYVDSEAEVFLEIPKPDLPDDFEDFVSLLPANTRVEYEKLEKQEYRDDDDISLKGIYEQIKERDMKNLEYMEWASKEYETA